LALLGHPTSATIGHLGQKTIRSVQDFHSTTLSFELADPPFHRSQALLLSATSKMSSFCPNRSIYL
uniref:Ovule protein n=1 Tax=Toxocara canis TaxID=6265 RepID=A0A183VGJ0_TOXCA